MRDQEVQEEALAAAGRAEHQRVTDVLHMQVEGVWRPMRRLEDGQRFLSKVRADGVAVIEREEETQVREVGFEHREASKIVRAVSRDDAQPGVEQVVGLLEEAAVVDGHGFHGLGGLMLQCSWVRAVQHECEGAPPKKCPWTSSQ